MTVFQTPYQQQSDEALCALAAQGDGAAEEALISRYTRMVRRLSRPLFLMGGDSEDLIQEGMLGLWKAVRDYVPDRGASFKTFAQTCVKNSMLTAVKTAAGKHHIPSRPFFLTEVSSCPSVTRRRCISTGRRLRRSWINSTVSCLVSRRRCLTCFSMAFLIRKSQIKWIGRPSR